MKHSLYVKAAVVLLRWDIEREHRAWRRAHRRIAVDFPHLNEHLLRDIGIDPDGRMNFTPAPHVTASRRAKHLRRLLRFRHTT
uniref:DUF1127 domain-containing protein n=1 Tax=Thaumasiovibrio occultus TaxID=1891184 RepID=UPI000B360A59|nr:DUF1127 domain-containing protein [Thaumasiovibrio occultus]